MLSGVAKNLKIRSELDKEIPEEYFDAIATPLNERKRKSRLSTTLNWLTENESTERLERLNFIRWPNVGIVTDLSPNVLLSDEDDTSFVPVLQKNKSIVPTLSKRQKVAENEVQSHKFAEDYLRKALSKTSSIQRVKKLFIDILKAYNLVAISNSVGDQTHENLKWRLNIQNFKMIFFQSLHDIINRQAVSYVLTDERLLNIRFTDATRPKDVKVSSEKNRTRKRKKSVYHNCLAIEPPALPESDTIEKCKINHQLNLLCVFTDSAYIDGITSDLSKPWAKEDIKIILPTALNVVVAQNVVTVSDENNQNIRILFPKPLKTRVNHEKSNLTTQKYILPSSSEEPSCTDSDNSIALKHQTMKVNHLRGKATKIDKESQKNNSAKRKRVRELFSRKQDFFSLQKPLLLNYVQEKKRKQILMYKDHSLQNVSKGESSKRFHETLQELLSKSVPYEGEPVSLVFDPSRLMNRLKKEERITNFLIRTQPSQSRQDLLENSAFIQFIKKKSIKTESKELATVASIAGCTDRESNQVSQGPVVQCQKCLQSRIFKKDVFSTAGYTDRGSNQVSQGPVVQCQKCLQSRIFKKDVFSTAQSETGDDVFREQSKRNTLRKDRTAMKRLNAKKVVSSVFRHFFHFYSMVGGRLQSGAVITRANSSYWLRLSGVAKDSSTLDNAEKLFIRVAGRKVVLNIYDYLKFLVQFAMRERITVTELVTQMMMCDISSIPTVLTPTNVKSLKKKCTEESEQCSSCLEIVQ